MPNNNEPLYYPTHQGLRQSVPDPRNMNQMAGIGGLEQNMPETYGGQAGMIPFLMDLLWRAYADHLERKLKDRARAGQEVKSLNEALKAAPASHFIMFCEEYLARHRPVQQFPSDANLGFMLSNNVRALLCPAVQGAYTGYGGQMQDAQEVNITHGRSQPGMDGTINDGGIPII